MTRDYWQNKGQHEAGMIDETEDWTYCRVLGSFNMYVMKGDQSVSPHLVNNGYWEAWITSWFDRNTTAEMLFYDIGANTGYYSFFAASKGATVYAFEPNPRYAHMMIESSKRNELDVTVVPCALSNYDGEAVLNIPLQLHGSASLNEIPPGYEFEQVTVSCFKFDSLDPLAVNVPILVKIDAEGEEERVWEGMKEFRETYSPTFLIEVTPGAYSDAFYDDLFAYGLVTWIDHYGSEQLIDKTWLYQQSDWQMLAVRKA